MYTRRKRYGVPAGLLAADEISPSSGARIEMSEKTGPNPSTTGEADLEALRTRMHVYESFDSVISENTSNARNILIEAAELRERVTREVTQEREALYAEIADKRARLDAEFVGLRASFDADLQALREEFEQELIDLRASTDNDLVATRQLIVDEQNRFAAAQTKIAATARAILGLVEGMPASDAPAPITTITPEPAIEPPAKPLELAAAPEPIPSPQPIQPSPAPVEVQTPIAKAPAAPKGDPAKINDHHPWHQSPRRGNRSATLPALERWSHLGRAARIRRRHSPPAGSRHHPDHRISFRRLGRWRRHDRHSTPASNGRNRAADGWVRRSGARIHGTRSAVLCMTKPFQGWW